MSHLNLTHLRPSRVAAAAAVALSLGLAACGDDEGGGGASSGEGPASLVPADAPVYVESVVRPEGEARETIDRLYEAVTGESDAGAAIIREFDASAQEDGADFTYEDDVSPWLGERGAFFFGDVTSLIESEGEVSFGETSTDIADPGCIPPTAPDGEPLEGADSISPDDESCAQPEPGTTAEDIALIVETTDEDAAQEAIDKLADFTASEEGAEVTEDSYEGVDFLRVEGDDAPAAVGIVDGFLVVGDETGFASVVDTAGGDSLADDSEFTDGVSELTDEPFLAAYVDTPAIFEEVEASGEIAPEDQAAIELYRGYLEQPIFFASEIDDEAIEFASSTGTIGATLTEEGLLDDLPAGSLAAFGIPNLGDYFNSFIDRLRAEESFGSEFDEADAQFRREVGLALEDALANIGDLRGFIRGENVLALNGAITLEVESQGPLADLIDGVRTSAKSDGERVEDVVGLPGVPDARGFSVAPDGAPQPIFVVQNESTLIVAYGEEAVAEAVAPSAPLGDDEKFADAVDDIDDVDPSFYIDMTPIEALVGLVPVTPEEFSADQAASVIGEFEYFIGGARTDGDRDLTRYRLGLTGD
ncbi:DUF3352 domain-containing protein [Thermoleophilia bacterium SCSIO 60948]|nr:DUF3352 domain-containing protein [Thermoleophilia bacterium SCSIO 60948]